MVSAEWNEASERHEYGWTGDRPGPKAEADALEEYNRSHDIHHGYLRGAAMELSGELVVRPGWTLVLTGKEYSAPIGSLRSGASAPSPGDRIRIIAPADAPAIQSLINGSLSDFPENRVSLAAVREDLFGTDSYGFILESSGEDVAFGHAYIDGRSGEINWVCVRADRQGHGFGKRTLNLLIGHLAEVGVEKVGLWMASKTPWAVRFYESAGFRTTSGTICFLTWDRP